MGWKTHALLGGLKRAVPLRRWLRAIKRARFPYQSNAENDMGLLVCTLRQVSSLIAAGGTLPGSTVLELGTGWVPIAPISFWLAGAERIVSIDQERLMDAPTFRYAVKFVRTQLAEALRRTGVNPCLLDEARLTELDSVGENRNNLSDLCGEVQLQYRAPFDFLETTASSADFVVSRAVLEHIPECSLSAIFSHTRAVLRCGGLVAHNIDMSDHFEHRDKRISRVNFLRYEDRLWRWAVLDAQLYTNRLRRFEYADLLTKAGFEILQISGEPNAIARDALMELPLCSRYRGVSIEELAVLETDIVARPKSERAKAVDTIISG